METVQTSSLKQPLLSEQRNTHRTSGKPGLFYIAASFLVLVIVLTGFSNTYIVPMASGTFKSIPAIHIHGSLFFLWIVLFIAQPTLVRLGYTQVHRKIGIAGFVLAVTMVVFGVTIAILSAKAGRAGGTNLPPNSFLLVPLSDMVLFSSFIMLSLLNLKNSEVHKRLMVLATVAILPAAFGRIFLQANITNPIAALFLLESITLLGVAYDLKTRKQVHKVYLWGGSIMFIIHLIRMPLSTSDLWLTIANWIVN